MEQEVTNPYRFRTCIRCLSKCVGGFASKAETVAFLPKPQAPNVRVLLQVT